MFQNFRRLQIQRGVRLLPKLRSAKWLEGTDEVALLHRVALASAGISYPRDGGAPIIGIANSASELNPCNMVLASLALEVKKGISAAGGVAVEFPSMSLGEDLMKPTAMLYRNLLSIEIEEMIRANPLDGIVILANCDKTVPGALMGAVSADIPTVLVTGGARAPAEFEGKRIGTGTDLWRLSEKRRVGDLDDGEWAELERCLGCAAGACNTMGTASTMAILSETLGLMVPYSSTIPSNDSKRYQAAMEAGKTVVRCVIEGMSPSSILSNGAFSNAIKVLHAIGGSTNAVIHLAALAGRVGVNFRLGDVDLLGKDIPVLADVEPSGSGLVQDFDRAGGVPVLLRELSGHLDTSAMTVSGQSIGTIIASAGKPGGVIRTLANPIKKGGAFSVVRGSLAPDGGIIKTSAASKDLLYHVGHAVVFYGYEDMMARIDDPDLVVDVNSVLVLSGCGPVGVPGMPEWGMIPIPAKLASQGISDMVRVTDARMSGTSFGTVVLHVAPEAAIGGPIALVRDGDLIELNVAAGTLELKISDQELFERRSRWVKPLSPHIRGWPALYQQHVLQAPEGCDLDFLRAPTSEHRVFVEPVIGRS